MIELNYKDLKQIKFALQLQLEFELESPDGISVDDVVSLGTLLHKIDAEINGFVV